MSSALKMRTFSPSDRTVVSRAVILVLHGGCFTKGDETYHNDMCRAWATKLGSIVITLGFSVVNLDEAMIDIQGAILQIKSSYPLVPFGLFGCSSGGFLALCAAVASDVCEFAPAFLVTMAAVVDPWERFLYLQKEVALFHARDTMIKQQLQFFGTLDKMKFVSQRIRTTRTICPSLHIFAGKDRNIPASLAQAWIVGRSYKDEQYHWIHEAKHCISYKPSAEVTSTISKFLQQHLPLPVARS